MGGSNRKILVTGVAGFIGFSLAKKLLSEGKEIIGVDNINDYYDVKLKKDRLKILEDFKSFKFYKLDISKRKSFETVFIENKIDKVCHLAAQAGVRYSLENPYVYQESNVLGFLNLLEMMRKYVVGQLVYASSSSVYGGIKEVPFKEEMKIDRPVSLYAASKGANELYASVYNHLFGIKCVGLRFFTVYGPWGRPDMALFLFTKAIMAREEIKVFGWGKMKRDFTYVDDIVNGVCRALARVNKFDNEIFNLGCSSPVKLMNLISLIEKNLGMEAKKVFLPMQPGDMKDTYADVSKANKLLDYRPKIKIKVGVQKFIEWYKQYYV